MVLNKSKNKKSSKIFTISIILFPWTNVNINLVKSH